MSTESHTIEFDMREYAERVKAAYTDLAEAERQGIQFHFKKIGVTFEVMNGQIVPVKIDRSCTDCSSVAVVSKRKRR